MTFKAGDKIRMREWCEFVEKGEVYKLIPDSDSGKLRAGGICSCEDKWEKVEDEEESMQAQEGMTCKLAQAAIKTIEYLQKRIEEHMSTCGKCATKQK